MTSLYNGNNHVIYCVSPSRNSYSNLRMYHRSGIANKVHIMHFREYQVFCLWQIISISTVTKGIRFTIDVALLNAS